MVAQTLMVVIGEFVQRGPAPKLPISAITDSDRRPIALQVSTFHSRWTRQKLGFLLYTKTRQISAFDFSKLNSESVMDLGRQVFTVDVLERHAAKGRGVVTCMAAGNDVIVIGTSKGWIIRHDFGVGDTYGTFISLITLRNCISFDFFHEPIQQFDHSSSWNRWKIWKNFVFLKFCFLFSLSFFFYNLKLNLMLAIE